MEEKITKVIQDVLAHMGAGVTSFVVERPGDMAHGDYATNAALVAAKQLGKNPKQLAEELVPALEEGLGDDAANVTIAGPGFVNITLSHEAVARMIREASAEQWGKGTARAGKKVMVEYSCPNPFKEMHIGHLLSTVIGESVSRLTQYEGAQVLRDSYGGDVGPHVAKALWALREKGITEPSTAREIGEAYEHGARAYEESEEAHAAIDTLNVRLYEALAKDPSGLEDEDRALLEVWRKGRDAALEAFRDIYRVLDTTFDYYFFESEVTPIGLRVVEDGLAKGVFQESEGAVIYPGERKGLHTLVFITSRGTPTYEAKDIGLAFYKEERVETDEIIIETGSEQIGHFKVFLAALAEIAPQVASKMTHLSHGLLTLTTGKMSSRKGNVITARQLIEEVMDTAKERNEDLVIAEQVTVAALKYMILRSAPGGSITFDPEKSLSLEGDSGPYLQYAYVRAKKILEYGDGNGGTEEPDLPYDLERLIIHFPEVVARAARERAPHHVAQYVTELAAAWNSFYASEQVLGSPEEMYKQRVAKAFARTMQNGLWLLGIPVPEKM